MPISIPVIDMVEIGAGGGSLARVDSLNQIRVGPESAGSEPGPACYGRGGTRPSVSDADLVLGKLDPDNFAGGSFKLDPEAAKQALVQEIGTVLEMDALTSAYGIAEVVDENMANAARVHAVENGEDLAGYTMIAFGGAAPLHAVRLCEKLGIERLLVPSGAGVGSAIGFLRAPFSFEANRTVFMRLSDLQASNVKALIVALENEAVSFVRSCDGKASIGSDYKVYMRYSGQGWEIPVIMTREQLLASDPDVYSGLFQEAYANLFGRAVEGLEIEITVWSVKASTELEAVKSVRLSQPKGRANITDKRALFDPNRDAVVQAGHVRRESLKRAEGLDGPVIITENETTIILSEGYHAVIQADGCVDIRKKGQA